MPPAALAVLVPLDFDPHSGIKIYAPQMTDAFSYALYFSFGKTSGLRLLGTTRPRLRLSMARSEWNWPRSAHEWLAALIGGIIMGYGARLSGGCNIGAYFSSISSGDLSGWIWALCAFIGTFAGVRLSQKYFLD
ncbi:TPA: YeeE/YedE family protein [Legionella pneumophila subsp. pneumophila]|nr:YeeE/YedE family protein [Legionella pneumophila]HAT9084913.1 YeeE/YedE family protein [Legionella pneumophila subsp. pneumophila]HAU9911356.1 YeeE/YedE family protein [Legionella pneumophila]HAV1167776.1 YeeE/YedE family protein [Legionella pneumophila]